VPWYSPVEIRLTTISSVIAVDAAEKAIEHLKMKSNGGERGLQAVQA
jgi:hypothetical protein